MQDFNTDFGTLKDVRLIIVHGGQTSHQDEQIACALAVAYGATNEIVRRDPTAGELTDPTTLVLDVGGVLDKHLNNYDHHQLSREQEDCAYSLLAGALDCLPEFEHLFPWAKPGVVMDVRGPFEVSKRLGITPNDLFGVLGPAREYHDCRWANDANYRHAYTTWLADQIKVKLSVYGELDGFAYADPYMPELSGVKVLRGDLVEKAHPENAKLLIDLLSEEYRQLQVVVFNDDRGPGFGLLRLRDDPDIDFSLLEGDPCIVFAHKGGFIAKTISKGVDLTDLIGKAKRR